MTQIFKNSNQRWVLIFSFFLFFGGFLNAEEKKSEEQAQTQTNIHSPSTYTQTPSYTDRPLSPFNPFPEEKEQELTHTPFMSQFMKMLFFLGLIVAFMLFGSYFLKKMVNARLQQTNQENLIKVLEQRALSGKTTLYLLNVENKEILIAESPSGVVSLTQYETQHEDLGMDHLS